MKRLHEIFAPRSESDFKQVLSVFEADGYTVGSDKTCERLFVFNNKRFIVMLQKHKQFGNYDYAQNAWKVKVMTQSTIFDPEFKPRVEVVVSYPQKFERINLNESDMVLFTRFVSNYVAQPAIQRLKMGRKYKIKSLQA